MLRVVDFLDNIENYTEEEIIANMQYIRNSIPYIHFWNSKRNYLLRMFKVADKDKILQELFRDSDKFILWKELLDFPQELKFGLEIEVADLPLSEIQYAFCSGAVSDIMGALNIPTDISNAIIQKVEFERKDEFNKWIFSKEGTGESSEASSPIMQNNLLDLNQVVAICTLLNALNARLNGGTGLHINVGADYLECNERAIENLLKIWGECEELFFKMANPVGEVMRVIASNMAIPIKENIQTFFQEDGSVKIETDEDMERFLYQIQAHNRMKKIVEWENLGMEYNLGEAENDEERFRIYQRYNYILRERGDSNSQVRWTSINFNHMKWNAEDVGRIEIRIFNSSLEPEIIFQDLVLVGKILEVSLKNAKDPNYKRAQFERLFLHDVTEARKVNSLLELLFDSPEQRNIFKSRWQSVRRKKNEYRKYISGTDTFIR